MQKVPSYIEYVNVYVHGNDLFCCMFICYSQWAGQPDCVCVVRAADRSGTGLKCCLLSVFSCSSAHCEWSHSQSSQRVGSNQQVKYTNKQAKNTLQLGLHSSGVFTDCCILDLGKYTLKNARNYKLTCIFSHRGDFNCGELKAFGPNLTCTVLMCRYWCNACTKYSEANNAASLNQCVNYLILFYSSFIWTKAFHQTADLMFDVTLHSSTLKTVAFWVMSVYIIM